MKTTNLFLVAIILMSTINFISCDKDDDVKEPQGAVAVNMLNESNGKTLLGTSDVYIDKANNFTSNWCAIARLGKKNGLQNADPLLQNLADKVAVEPGNCYQIFNENALYRFPSGEYALNIDADYYNVFVASQIKQDDKTIGANVKYALQKVPKHGLPEYDKNIGVLNPRLGVKELTIELPTSDFEYEPRFANSQYYILHHQKDGKKIIVEVIELRRNEVFGFYIRIKGSYTYVYGKVEN